MVKRDLADENIKKWRTARKPLLKDEHAAESFLWAEKYKDWGNREWVSIV
jgi:hypothetical protein